MITDAIETAYQTMRSRNWDTIYWAVDLHGVCLKSNYESGVHQFLSYDAIVTLQYLSGLPETKIILWSSVYDEQKAAIIELFEQHNIKVFGFNENPAEGPTKTGSFHQKFYFSVLLDDKAGFRPARDWKLIRSYLFSNRHHFIKGNSK